MVRVLVVSNMWPTPERPALGTFVRDQVEALRRRTDVEVDLATFGPGALHYLTAIPGLTRRRHYDVVHAHFGLTAVPALAAGATIRGVTLHGTDLISPRSRRVTLAVLPRYDVVGVPSTRAKALLPEPQRARAGVLPCGIDLATFSPIDRAEARRALGLDPSRPFAVFPYDPARAVKRHDLALQAAGTHHLQTLGREPRYRMRLWLNAASVVICPSDWETFGMAAVESVACGTAVIATPTGVHEEALGPLDWSMCEPFNAVRWGAFVDRAIAHDAQHPGGMEHVEHWSSDAMAGHLMDAWSAAAGTRRHRRR